MSVNESLSSNMRESYYIIANNIGYENCFSCVSFQISVPCVQGQSLKRDICMTSCYRASLSIVVTEPLSFSLLAKLNVVFRTCTKWNKNVATYTSSFRLKSWTSGASRVVSLFSRIFWGVLVSVYKQHWTTSVCISITLNVFTWVLICILVLESFIS